jgi:aminoglycoside phosphotransferase (APT) family kinase protein
MNQTQVAPAQIRHYRRLVRRIVNRHFGKPASRIVYNRTGLTNYVFAVNHLEGQFVIRISPDPEKINSFKKEQWATQKVREAGVPTQEVLAVGTETTSEPYMIARRVTGVAGTHHPRRRSIVHELGAC